MADESVEMRRMLLWFKAQLPPHDFATWHIAARPEPEPYAIEGELADAAGIGRWGKNQVRIVGHAECARCGRHFAIPKIGNAIAFDESRVGAVVEEMKAWVQREAEREGPCWGDVPDLPPESSIVMDGVLDYASTTRDPFKTATRKGSESGD